MAKHKGSAPPAEPGYEIQRALEQEAEEKAKPKPKPKKADPKKK